MLRGGVLVLVLCLLPASLAACDGGSNERAGNSTYKTPDVRRMFARHGMPLVTEITPEDKGHPSEPTLVLSGPGHNEDTQDIRVLVWVFATGEAARTFEAYSREGHLGTVGDVERNDLIFGEGNLVVWYDTGGTPEQLQEVKAALKDLAAQDAQQLHPQM